MKVVTTTRSVITTSLCYLILLLSAEAANADKNTNETEAIEFLAEYNEVYGKLLNEYTLASWAYDTNITDENAAVVQDCELRMSSYNEEALEIASTFDSSNFSQDTQRQLKEVGTRPLPEEEEIELSNIISEMGKVYGSAEVCLGEEEEQCYNLEPELTDIMAESTNFTLRTYIWQEWRKTVGQTLKDKYKRYVELKNKRAQLNGYKDAGDRWRQKYDTTTLEDDVLNLYSQMEDFYKQLHAYVRRKLYDVYGAEVIDLKGPLPASILSDMWGRFWGNLYKHLVPYPDKPNLDPSEAMKEQGYDVMKMFKTGDDFYAAMGLQRVPDTFWNLSMLEKPTDGRQVICHATAWDFYDGKDFRIRMCTRNYSFEDLNTIHHELGHIQYQMQYSNLPTVFRDGANDGFHEAIGELMAMSGATPKHLYSLGLIDELVEDEELDVNFLMSQSLITISTLPFHLVNDLWRWKVFRGEFPEDQWNQEFWKLKREIVGVVPPVERTEADLDPPTLFHICQDYDMIRYFVRTILQFQFAEALCNISGHQGPLHRCDFSGSAEAGQALAQMLQMGKSQSWQDALEVLTGTREMSVQPILRFFQPLYDWLVKTNQANGDQIGWQ